jgi:hypothetical protein
LLTIKIQRSSRDLFKINSSRLLTIFNQIGWLTLKWEKELTNSIKSLANQLENLEVKYFTMLKSHVNNDMMELFGKPKAFKNMFNQLLFQLFTSNNR